MARRRITEASDTPDNDLPDLTEKQMKFVEGILAGKTASDAYRAAYDVANMQSNSIWVAASRLRSDTNIALWIAAARKAGLGKATVTLDGHLSELERLREIALDTGNVGAAVQAEQLRGKAAGHYVDKFADVTDHDPLATLKEIEKISPDLARQMAREANIELPTETRH